MLVVGTSLVVFNVQLLLLKERASDPLDVVEQGLTLYVTVQNRVVFFKGVNVFLANAEAGTLGVSFVDEEGAAVEAGLVCTNYGLGGVTDLELYLFIDFISNIVEAIFDENYFIHVIKL